MSEKQHKHQRSDKSTHKSSSRRMEDDLNRSSFRSGDAAGRPPPDKVPRTSGVDPCVPPRGDEPYFQREASAQPQTGNETSHGAIPVSTQIPPQEAIAAPVAQVPATSGQLYDGSYADSRGADPAGYEHGADYGGHAFQLVAGQRRRGCFQGGVPLPASAGARLEDAGLWGPVWPSTPQRPKHFTSDVLRQLRGGEPVLAGPRAYRGRHGKDGTSSRGLDSCASGVVRGPFDAFRSR
jgi:hypothetical protein